MTKITQLGKLKNNFPETILDAFIQQNKHLIAYKNNLTAPLDSITTSGKSRICFRNDLSNYIDVNFSTNTKNLEDDLTITDLGTLKDNSEATILFALKERNVNVVRSDLFISKQNNYSAYINIKSDAVSYMETNPIRVTFKLQGMPIDISTITKKFIKFGSDQEMKERVIDYMVIETNTERQVVINELNFEIQKDKSKIIANYKLGESILFFGSAEFDIVEKLNINNFATVYNDAMIANTDVIIEDLNKKINMHLDINNIDKTHFNEEHIKLKLASNYKEKHNSNLYLKNLVLTLNPNLFSVSSFEMVYEMPLYGIGEINNKLNSINYTSDESYSHVDWGWPGGNSHSAPSTSIEYKFDVLSYAKSFEDFISKYSRINVFVNAKLKEQQNSSKVSEHFKEDTISISLKDHNFSDDNFKNFAELKSSDDRRYAKYNYSISATNNQYIVIKLQAQSFTWRNAMSGNKHKSWSKVTLNRIEFNN